MKKESNFWQQTVCEARHTVYAGADNTDKSVYVCDGGGNPVEAGGVWVKKTDVEQVVDWTQLEAGKGNMLPKTVEEIIRELQEGRGVIAYNGDEEPVAYCRYLVWHKNLIEVGGTVVNPDPAAKKRRKGAGTRVNLQTIAMAHKTYPEAAIIGLAENAASCAMVSKMGAIEADKDEVDPIVWDLCWKSGQECAHFLAGEFPEFCPCILFILTHLAEGDQDGS